MRIFSSLTELVGHTPILALKRYQAETGAKARILAKLESFNPSSSAKDRAALSMIDEAERSGKLTPGSVIIEPTSGNTGIALAWIACTKGYRTIIVMPDSMSAERRALMKAYGAELVLTPGAEGMSGAIRKAQSLSAEIPGSFIPGQFDNPSNVEAHFKSTGPEIWTDTDGQVDILVAGVGTGGTLSGTGKYLKSVNSSVHVVAVEPHSSPVLSGGQASAHKIQGIGAGFIPSILNREIIDQIVTVENEKAFETLKLLVKSEGVLVGISAGAALWAATELAKEPANEGKIIVVILPDTGERYLSTPGYIE